MWGNRNKEMKTLGTTPDSTMSVVFGAAQCQATLPVNTAAERMCRTMSKDSNSLKYLSMQEILKLAENRAKINGISSRSTDNPWHKRMAVSDNITRSQASPNIQANHQQAGFDNNDEFFENLMKKMTKEQFISCDKASRKRERLWNKENSSNFDKIKRQRDNKMMTRFIPPRTGMFTKRLLPQQNNDYSATPAMIQSQCVVTEKREPRRKTTLDMIGEDAIMEKPDSHLKHFNSSMALTMTEIDESFDWNRIGNADNRRSTCTQETLKLLRDHPINKIDLEHIHNIPLDHYYIEKYPKNVWGSPRLLSTEKYRQLSMIVESPVLHAIDTTFDISQLAPPVLVESSNCEACNIDKAEYEDSVNIESTQLLSPMISLDSDHHMLGIVDQSLFT